ncbi:glycosyl transferase group 1 [Candidatus Vecturithrix granuli]|uniref:Glycosyl transferase group 1 n=1 Tax=Vecturithrix granuli TaxID=1499967 RepID=A0A081C2G4_VECG1|nr:glycosyl transferase group 1 [Candidatus Vecturithrix granuli]
MKIGIFTDCYFPTKNGISTSIVHLKEGLEQQGHQVMILTVKYPHYEKQEPTIYRFPSFPFNSMLELRVGLAAQRTLNRIVQTRQFDILHTHTEFSLGWSAKRAARTLYLPIVHTVHTMYQDYRHYLWGGKCVSPNMIQWFFTRFLAGYDAVICPSQKMQAYLSGFLPALKTVVIGNGVSQTRFSPNRLTTEERARIRGNVGLCASDKMILFVGRLAQEKRVLELLRVLASLLQQHPHYKIVFVGDGPLHQQIQSLARKHAIAQQVILTGYIPWENMYNIYALADLFVTASLSEVHPMTLIEAAMCGLPIVVRRDKSYTDIVQDDCNGCLADTDGQLAEQVAALLQDDVKRHIFSQHALSVAEKLTSEKYVERCEALYKDVIQRKILTTDTHR